MSIGEERENVDGEGKGEMRIREYGLEEFIDGGFYLLNSILEWIGGSLIWGRRENLGGKRKLDEIKSNYKILYNLNYEISKSVVRNSNWDFFIFW